MSELFRREAVRHATRRLEGEVILATPVSLKTLGLLLGVVVVAATAFLFRATYSRKETVPGFIIPDQGMVRAVSRLTGSVQSVLVKEGSIVSVGERLALVNLAEQTSGGDVGDLLASGLTSEGRAARAKAEATLARLQVDLEQTHNRLAKTRAEQEGIRTQIRLQEQRVKLAQDDVDRAAAMVDRGFTSRKDVDARRSTLLLAQQELVTGQRLMATNEREIADLTGRLASIPLEIAGARADADSAEASLTQRRAEQESRHLQFVTAPIAGRIAALPATSGQTLVTGATVAVIVPEGGRLEAELLAPSRAIGFVKAGQEVRLSLQAFPYQRFGTLPGTIRSVSTTVLAPAEVSLPGLNLQEPAFRIRVSIPTETIEAYGEAFHIQPGMLLSADIVFDRRTLIEWLFDPIYAVARRT